MWFIFYRFCFLLTWDLTVQGGDAEGARGRGFVGGGTLDSGKQGMGGGGNGGSGAAGGGSRGGGRGRLDTHPGRCSVCMCVCRVDRWPCVGLGGVCT